MWKFTDDDGRRTVRYDNSSLEPSAQVSYICEEKKQKQRTKQLLSLSLLLIIFLAFLVRYLKSVIPTFGMHLFRLTLCFILLRRQTERYPLTGWKKWFCVLVSLGIPFFDSYNIPRKWSLSSSGTYKKKLMRYAVKYISWRNYNSIYNSLTPLDKCTKDWTSDRQFHNPVVMSHIQYDT